MEVVYLDGEDWWSNSTRGDLWCKTCKQVVGTHTGRLDNFAHVYRAAHRDDGLHPQVTKSRLLSPTMELTLDREYLRDEKSQK